MPFVKIEGFKGKLYIPEDDMPKKHPCEDCFACQFCPDERCALCLKKNPHLATKKDKDKTLP